jgi:hypothetical protein
VNPPPTGQLKEYVGCLRVHTAYGEGTEKLPAIIRAANQAELDFLVVSDTNSTHYISAGMEGWYDRTAVIVGQEVSGEGIHCLALGVKKDVSGKGNDAEATLSDIHAQGGVGILCSPHSDGQAKAMESADGLEVWSFLSDWRAGLTLWNRWRRKKNPARHLGGPSVPALARWDAVLRRRPAAALAGLNAKGLVRHPRRGRNLFTYRQLFELLRVHLTVPPLTKRFFEDKRVLLDALRRGQGFLANDGLAPAKGFRFEIQRADGSVIPMGQEAAFESSLTLRVRLPQPATVRLITDGEAWFTDTRSAFDVELNGAGVIRLEAHLDGRPWIFTNPIYLRPAVPEMVSS